MSILKSSGKNILIHKYPPMETSIPENNPTINNNPISALRIAAAASGPGVGGTKTCAEYNPVAKHTARTIIFFPVTLDISLIIEDIKINAASQKTGIDIINQNIFKVKGILLYPSNEINEPTIFFVNPPFCKKTPNRVPAIIICPIPNKILLNPSNINKIVSWNEISNINPETNPAERRVI